MASCQQSVHGGQAKPSNQTPQQSSAGPHVSLLRPEVQQQRHHASNQRLGSQTNLSQQPFERVWWRCDQCLCEIFRTNGWLLLVTSSSRAQIFILPFTNCFVDCVGVGGLDVSTRQAPPSP